ncbi:hypothetical protein FD430_16275 [Salmonella enterica]|nr:hypothetical protein [Salmonella enterica]ECC1747243.1 hypothetical protein [Salmonella enterica subsp. diarizonae]EAP9279526.1 hypothetical protein [Salmonella enterica]EAV5427509.1 hypothetical protein [Salmonella enterica]EAV7850381.1 hypothetical protein [Salmonella enterica]
MDFSWIPSAFEQVRLLWESIYARSPSLAYFVIIAIFSFPFYAIFAWSKFGVRESKADARVAKATRSFKQRKTSSSTRVE